MTYTAHEVKGGIFEICTTVEVTQRLRYMPYAQAGWRIYWDYHKEMEMISYSSRIFTAKFDESGVAEIHTMNADAAINYSRTTSKQVTAAMRELGLPDREIAMLKKWFTSDSKHVTAVYIGRGKWVNGATGEVIL